MITRTTWTDARKTQFFNGLQKHIKDQGYTDIPQHVTELGAWVVEASLLKVALQKHILYVGNPLITMKPFEFVNLKDLTPHARGIWREYVHAYKSMFETIDRWDWIITSETFQNLGEQAIQQVAKKKNPPKGFFDVFQDLISDLFKSSEPAKVVPPVRSPVVPNKVPLYANQPWQQFRNIRPL